MTGRRRRPIPLTPATPLPPEPPLTSFAPLLAHIGSPNNPWIGVMTVSAWVLLVVFALVVARRITVDAPGDLLLPFAVVVLVAGLTGSLGDVINDQGPWAVPAGLVVLVALLVAAFGDVDFRWGERPTFVVIGLSVVAAVALFTPLENLWFPTGPEDVTLPVLDDAVVSAEVVQPLDEDGRFVVRVTLENASFGNNSAIPPSEDPEEGLRPKFPIGTVALTPPIPEACATMPVCTEAEFELTLPPGFVDDPPERFEVEMLTARELPFAPPLRAEFDPTAAG